MERRWMARRSALPDQRSGCPMERETMNRPKEIPLSLLGYYTAGIDMYFQDHEGEETPADLEIFRRDAEETRDQARSQGEIDELREAIDFILASDEGYLAREFDLTLA